MSRCSTAAALVLFVASSACAEGPLVPVGLARVEVTPKTPIRLSGYASRKTESEGVAQKLYARALAVGGRADAAVLVTVDVLGVPAAVTEDVAGRLAKAVGLPRERFAVCATHTHCGPTIRGNAPLILVGAGPDELARIDRYTSELADGIEAAARQALADRKPARLAWAEGSVGFAMNRRIVDNGRWVRFGENRAGPVDRALPVLRIADPDGKVRGVLVNYACHGTTLVGDFNRVHGDWPGVAAELLEGKFPGAVAMVSLGCAGDADPFPRRTEEAARVHGQAVADEVAKLFAGGMKPLSGPPVCRLRRLDLPLAPLPTKEQWEERAKGKGGASDYAKLVLERLARGEKPATAVPYVVQGWAFGDDLAMVFLAGEVVADYSLRLKKELDGKRLWVAAYANDVPCYIASERLLAEGGYEVASSMLYYDYPGPLAPEAEDAIVAAVKEVVPKAFLAAAKYPQLPLAKSPAESLAAIAVRPGFAVELVAAEPLVADPVDIAWGADGKLWVVEMADYPLGLDGKGKPGGRVRFLEDTDGDGKYDKSTLFLDGLPFPTGVMPWRSGVLVTAAPNVLYAEDADGDGRAEVVRTLYAGFGEGNQQHRVNGPRWGLDNWVSLANGDSNGKVRSEKTGSVVDVRGRDLRIKPDTGELDALTGQAQFGRNRDDWGDWFGCDNSHPIWHYVLNDADLRRNPFLVPPRPIREVSETPGAAPVYPTSRTFDRFNDLHTANRFTSACGTNIYRDDLLGPAFAGNAFTCEPVHNLVSRLVLAPAGVTFTGKRAVGEERAEFLASADNWFRPTAVHTGPDGALYVVDMYRQVIEHPQWIPADWQKELDLRAGHDKGRIYRIAPTGAARRTVPRLDKLNTAELVAALDSPNGWQRDTAHQLLVWKADPAAAEPLRRLAAACERAVARMQALCVLDGLGSLTAADVRGGLADAHPGVRRQAVRLSRGFLGDAAAADALIAKLADSDPKVRLELAYALGDLPGPLAGPVLERLIASDTDEYLRAAAFSSLNAKNVGDVLAAAQADEHWNWDDGPAVEGLFRMAAAMGKDSPFLQTRAISEIAFVRPTEGSLVPSMFSALIGLLDGLDAVGRKPTVLKPDMIAAWIDFARATAAKDQAREPDRVAAIRLLSRKPDTARADIPTFAELIGPRNPPAVQEAALAALVRAGTPDAADRLLAAWAGMSPRLRGRAVDAMAARTAWAERLVSAVEAGKVPVSHVDAAARQRLLRVKSSNLRERVEKLFDGAVDPNRAKVIEQYLAALPPKGDPANGRAVFRKSCAACHRLEEFGHPVGPDLMMATDKPADWFLTAIFDPNRAVEDRYVEYQAATADGRTVSGLLAAESGAGITLRGSENRDVTVLRADLESLTSTGRSPMPDGLEKELTPAAVADLLAYLAVLRPMSSER